MPSTIIGNVYTAPVEELLDLFMYVLSRTHLSTTLQSCQTFGGGTVVEEKYLFEYQPIRIKSTYADVLADWTTITKAVQKCSGFLLPSSSPFLSFVAVFKLETQRGY